MTRWDRPATLFYLDPPDWGCEDYYGKDMFSRDDFERLAGLLAEIQGRFILSINATPEVRHIFNHFIIAEVPTTYRLSGSAKAVIELVISN